MSDDRRKLLFEIGTEEIPAFALVAATAQLVSLATEALDAARIPHGEVRTMSTPRRIALMVSDLADSSTPLMQRAKGPAVAIAFDADGNPTKAAQGFARGKGVEVRDLQRGVEDGREYVYAIVEQRARRTADLLPEILEGLITGLSWPRSQRWGTREERFSRPVRWLLALFGTEVVPVRFAGLEAGNLTRGHRLLADSTFTVASPDEYLSVLAKAWVVPDAAERETIIRRQIAEHEARTGLRAEVPARTLTEVVNLVEYPTVLLGHFEEKYLEVPSEIITDAMLSHQRYFPMYDPQGALANAFLVVSNGAPSRSAAIIDGNERVVRPRLADAAFFYYEDRRRPLEDYVAGLDRVVFQEKLGTVAAKTARIERLVASLLPFSGADEREAADALRAAHLCKADLITSAVVEFTSLQGVMGGYYARESGETEAVAQAICDHYHPRFAGDVLPRNLAGRMCALADKMDTIAGIFAIGQGPTGSSDPFAVRRSAIGIINILLDGLPVSLEAAIRTAVDDFEGAIAYDPEQTVAAVRDFFRTRLSVMAREAGFEPDTVAAVLAPGCLEPVEVFSRCEALARARSEAPDTFTDLATAYTRAANLTDADLGTDVDEARLTDADRALLTAVRTAESAVAAALETGDYPAAIRALAALRAPIDAFFEDVLIMDEDLDVRGNRLRLLNRFVAVFGNVADIGLLETR